jgi:hypothetical protein
MKKFVLLLIVCSRFLFASNDLTIVLEEIKNLRADMNKRFEQVDKRFEQNDKRFEQINKRLDFMQNLIIALFGVVIASPFAIEYMARRRDEEIKYEKENVQKILFTLRSLAAKDEKIKESLKISGLL